MFNSADSSGISVWDLHDVPASLPLSDHFKLREFACHDGSPVVLVHELLPVLLEEIRAKFGRPVHINSAYRTLLYNAQIGGTRNSRHTRGYAVDISISGVSPRRIATFADGLGVGGIGRYPSFVHLDVWGAGRRW